jgi:hypothetical protein
MTTIRLLRPYAVSHDLSNDEPYEVLWRGGESALQEKLTVAGIYALRGGLEALAE